MGEQSAEGEAAGFGADQNRPVQQAMPCIRRPAALSPALRPRASLPAGAPIEPGPALFGRRQSAAVQEASVVAVGDWASDAKKPVKTASDHSSCEPSTCASAASGENAARYGRVVVRASYTSTMPTIWAESGISSPRRRSG